MTNLATADPDSPADDSRPRRVGAIIACLAISLALLGIDFAVRRLGGFSNVRALANYTLGSDRVVPRRSDPGLVVQGDPVFFQNPDGSWAQVGYVESATPTSQSSRSPNPTDDVTLRWHDRRLDPATCDLTAYAYNGSLAETAQILFPESKRQQVRKILTDAFTQSGNDLANRFLPLLQQSIARSLPIIEQELLASLRRNEPLWKEISETWKDELIRQRLVPLAKDPILPIARRQLEPTLLKIGRELWDRASLWSFTWRMIYDSTPLPDKDLTREEWERFVAEEAVPILEAHSEDLAVSIQATIVDIARDPQVREKLGGTISDLASDPQVRQLVKVLLRETLIESEAVRNVWVDVWSGPEAKSAFEVASRSIEPFVRKIGDEILGSREDGIDPAFARVLRNQILGKDKRWIVATIATTQAPTNIQAPDDIIRPGTGDPVYPLLPK